MAFTLKQALEFNKFTMGLAAAGLAYAATIGSSSAAPTTAVSFSVRWISTFAIVSFAVSILLGALIVGRASKLSAGEEEKVIDRDMKRLGQAHSGALFVGLICSGFLMLNKIWLWF